MHKRTITSIAALTFVMGCQIQETPSSTTNKANLNSCLRTVMELNEGRWAYIGTIARVNGSFRTYEAVSIHASAGDDKWSAKSFGGDVGGDEESAELGYVKLAANAIVPLEDGTLNEELAVRYNSCSGPDAEGRYETRAEYLIPVGDGTFDRSVNMTWYSEHGSYYAEDHYDEAGRVIARRSGVYTPLAR